MDSAIFDEIQETLKKEGAAAAIDRLCGTLRDRKDYNALFYGLLLKKRNELGLTPLPTASAQEIPEQHQDAYEDSIREACRHVGQLYLDEGNIPGAWMYYRMIGEPDLVAKALESYDAEEGEDMQQVVEIAFHQGVHPRRGFDMVLKNFGLCSAITTASGELPFPEDVRLHCYNRLVHALHDELLERLEAEITAKEGTPPTSKKVSELVADRDWLFEDEAYHIDISHLNSVVQMSMQLPPGPELDLARDLCEYGKRLSPRLQGNNEPPFENNYEDYAAYLAVKAGVDLDKGLAHFRAKCDSGDPDDIETMPAEVLVNLLLSIDKPVEALEAARKYLANVEGWRLSCPNFTELCQRARDYQALAEVSREQGDSVHFLAGLLCAANGAG